VYLVIAAIHLAKVLRQRHAGHRARVGEVGETLEVGVDRRGVRRLEAGIVRGRTDAAV
jgi:hypothetical protein